MSPNQGAADIEQMFKSYLTAVELPRDELVQAWTRNCDLYAQYFAALARARGLEGLMTANMEFVTRSLANAGAGMAAASQAKPSPPKAAAPGKP